MTKKILIALGVLSVLFLLIPSATWEKPEPFKVTGAEAWADSIISTMSDEQALGQLFMVAAYSNKTDAHIQEIEKLIKNNGIGGVIFFSRRTCQTSTSYQSLSGT